MKKSRALILVALGAVTAGLSGAVAAGPDLNRGQRVASGDFNAGEAGLACARCHGFDGSGDSSGAFPRLSDQSAWYLYKTLKDFAAGLRPNEVMQTAARALSDAEMEDVAAYYASIDDAPYPPPPEADQQAVQIGGAIAAVGIPNRGVPACNTCHGESGVGSPPIYPYLAGQFAAYTEHQLMLWKNGERDGDPMNIMESIAKNMTDDQIRAVSLYFATLRPREVTPDEDSYLTLDEVDGQGATSRQPSPQADVVPAERAQEGQSGGQPEESQAGGAGQTESQSEQAGSGDSPADSTTDNGNQQDSGGQESGNQSGGGGAQ